MSFDKRTDIVLINSMTRNMAREHQPHYGLAVLASCISNSGFSVKIIDADYNYLKTKDLSDRALYERKITKNKFYQSILNNKIGSVYIPDNMTKSQIILICFWAHIRFYLRPKQMINGERSEL